MSKIQQISEIEPTIAFSEFDFYKSYEQSFHNSELGHLYRAIPFTAMAQKFGLKEKFKLILLNQNE